MRVSRGYIVYTWFVPARVAWLCTWFVPARVSRGYIHGLCPRACRMVIYIARTRVAWLHGLRTRRVVTRFARVAGYTVCLALALALALPRVTGSASFNAVAFLVIVKKCTF